MVAIVKIKIIINLVKIKINMKRTQTINHQGKNIFYMDFSNLQSMEEIHSVMNEAKAFILKQPKASVIALTNIDEMHFNNQIRDMFAEFIKNNKPHIKTSAIIGISGLKHILFNGLMKLTGRDIKSFTTIELAKNWLVIQN
jgi:hypothetical protein